MKLLKTDGIRGLGYLFVLIFYRCVIFWLGAKFYKYGKVLLGGPWVCGKLGAAGCWLDSGLGVVVLILTTRWWCVADVVGTG